MAMITAEKTIDANGEDMRSFECLRCGHSDCQDKPNDRRMAKVA